MAQFMFGREEMKANLMKAARDSRRALEKSLYKFASIEMTEMKRQVPVDTGTLRDSGLVDKPKWVNGSTLTIELGFGGAAGEYVIYVHEDLDAYHAVGNAKFVERPLKESEPYFMERIAADYAAEMGL